MVLSHTEYFIIEKYTEYFIIEKYSYRCTKLYQSGSAGMEQDYDRNFII